MTYAIGEDHALLVETVRDFARRALPERDVHWDRTETSCATELDALWEMGLMSLRIPEPLGGLDCPMLPYGHIIRELACASASVAVTVSVHNMVAEVVRTFASPQLRDEMLPRLAQPGNLAAFAISEPNSGSDPGAARTLAEPVAGGWRLRGAKMWVTNGIHGRWFVVLARTGGAGSGGGSGRDLSMFLLDAEQQQVQRSPIKGKLGIRGSETAEMHLDGAFVPEGYLLGEPGWGMRIALTALDGGRIGIASQAVGIAQHALNLSASYAKQRTQFGRPIADFQAISWMLADGATEVAAAQLLIDRAASLKDAGRPFTREASMAKLFASEAAGRIVDRGVQIHGGYGYVHEFRIEQLYRDARITRIYEGTSEIQRLVIARDLLKSGAADQ